MAKKAKKKLVKLDPESLEKMSKTKLTYDQVCKNDNILDEIEQWASFCGSDCLWEMHWTAKELEKEWDGYIRNLKKIKSLADKLKIERNKNGKGKSE